MTTPTFPTTLPNVLMTDYGYQPVDNRIRTEMEGGLPRMRRRFMSNPVDFDVRWKFSMTELGIFEKFYREDLMSGVAWFNIKLVNGAGETTYLARFKEPYSVKPEAREHYWSVAAKLETIESPVVA
jgi:hypothetical protein